MNEKKDRFSVPPIGASSLLSAFAVLCLVVFALLALSTVRSDERLSDASLQATKDYYAADCQAQEILARIRNGETPENVELTVSIAETPEGGARTYAYTVPISDTQELQVEIGQHPDLSCEVLRWQAAPTEEWVGSDDLDLWDGWLE